MSQTFFFYDLETSGLSPRRDRIMQFAGQRTDMDLNPIGETYNFLIRLGDDTLPSPGAIKVTGITPQKTVEEGYSEAEACDLIMKEIFTAGTIAVGYNNVRFDDEFMRFLFWRNLRDPYEWAYKDARSRWDLLDVVRFTRAIRPGKIKWPVDENGKATNRLELISAENGLTHTHAHDALSDVEALIQVARLIKQSDARLWDYLLKMRDKKAVQDLVSLHKPQAFVYSSGRLESEYEKTTVAYPIFDCKNNNIMVYNLRYDPSDLLDKNPAELAEFLSKYAKSSKTEDAENNSEEQNERRVYFKTFRFNRCPAVAPLSVLKDEDYARIKLSPELVKKHLKILRESPELIKTIQTLSQMKERQLEEKFTEASVPSAEEQLYDAFLPDSDRRLCQELSRLSEAELAGSRPQFSDARLPELFLSYKARSFSRSLSEAESLKWDKIKAERLQAKLPDFLHELEELAQDPSNEFIVNELQFWLENILPSSFV